MAGQGLVGIGMASAVLFAMTVSAYADDYSKLWKQGDLPPCFDVVPTHGAQDSTILINKCTGQTWLLGRVPIYDAKGLIVEGSDNYTPTWVPIGMDKHVAPSPP